MPQRTIALIAAGADPGGALASEADAIAVTVADARCAPSDLRAAAVAALEAAKSVGKQAFVVVNHPRTQLLRGDLEAVVGRHLDGVLLTHTTEPQDVRDLAVLLREFELQREIEPGTVRAFPIIDTARGLLRAAEIAGAAPRVDGLVFSSPGYAADVGARDEERGPRLAYARGAIVAAARAHDGLPLILSEGLDAAQLAHYGFAGIVLSDYHLVGQANAAFSVPSKRVERAQEHLAAYDTARGEGHWVGRWRDEVVDAHRARKARQVLD